MNIPSPTQPEQLPSNIPPASSSTVSLPYSLESAVSRYRLGRVGYWLFIACVSAPAVAIAVEYLRAKPSYRDSVPIDLFMLYMCASLPIVGSYACLTAGVKAQANSRPRLAQTLWIVSNVISVVVVVGAAVWAYKAVGQMKFVR